MKKILILFAHPRTDRSEVNVALAEAARSVDAVTFVDLYAEYPTFDIDVPREQERIVAHDVLVFQHPLYWYSCPAILKEWQDLVLEYGFAHGVDGRALAGKSFFNAVSCGASREAFSAGGANGYELAELLVPFRQTMSLCRARFLPPFALFAAGSALEDGRLTQHADAYRRLLVALAHQRLDLEACERASTLSDDLERLLLPPGADT